MMGFGCRMLLSLLLLLPLLLRSWNCWCWVGGHDRQYNSSNCLFSNRIILILLLCLALPPIWIWSVASQSCKTSKIPLIYRHLICDAVPSSTVNAGPFICDDHGRGDSLYCHHFCYILRLSWLPCCCRVIDPPRTKEATLARVWSWCCCLLLFTPIR